MSENIVIVSHKFLTQPDDDLTFFLNNNGYKNVLHIRHSFSDATDRCSYYSWYKEGKVFKEYRTADYRSLPEVCIYMKEAFFTFKWIALSRVKWNLYIGLDGLCVSFGNILRACGFADKTIYWSIDFVPNDRFKSFLKNKIYQWININGYKRSDEMWDLSPRMIEAREKFLKIRKGDYNKHRIVPYGAWLSRIKKYSYEECEKNTLVFMGHLLEKQGVQLVIKAMPGIIGRLPEFKFKIIGEGSYRESLISLANDLKVAEHCDFKGKIDDIKELENEIARSCVSIAPYISKLDTWTYYADPGKVKTYLACGLPVLLTEVPWNAREIEDNKCGKIIIEDNCSLTSIIIEFIDSHDNQSYRNNAISYSQKFDYENIFTNLSL